VKKIWHWLLIDNNRKVLSFLGKGLFVVVAASWTYFIYFDQAADSDIISPPFPSSDKQPFNITATWREISPNPGNLSQITQEGNSFSFVVKGTALGQPFQSSGNGTIEGAQINSTYSSTIPSTGYCSGTISYNGMQTKSICVDSVNGQFGTVWVRQ